MNRLYFIQVTFLLYSIACVDGQALYEDKCVTKDAKDVKQFKDREVELQTQVNYLKNQLSLCRDTKGFSPFQLRCLNEKGIYKEHCVTKNQYCFMRLPLTWDDGKTKCQSMGGYLLQIETQVEQTWLKETVYGNFWWTGGVRHKNGIDWIWNNSSSKMVFTNWDTDQPDNQGGEYCVVVTSLGRWHDYKCTREFYITCEMG